MKLWCQRSKDNSPLHKILSAAAYAGVSLDLEFCEGPTGKGLQEEVSTCDPCGRFPVLETEGNAPNLFEANAILRYVARLVEQNGAHIYGRTPFEASQVDMWIDFSASEIDAANSALARTAVENKRIVAGSASATAATDVETVLAGLDEVLRLRTFLVGERLTIADIAVAFSVAQVYKSHPRHGEALTRKYKEVFRHYNTVMNQPTVKEVLHKDGGRLSSKR